VQPVRGSGSGAGELVAAISQQPQGDQLAVDPDFSQLLGADGNHGDGVGVGGVGLAAVAGGEHPCSRREFRRHIQHALAVGDEPLRDVPADAVAAFDRPNPPRPPASSRQHLLVAVPVGAEPATAEYLLPLVEHLGRGRELVRVDPDDHGCHAVPPRLERRLQEAGGQRYFELSRPFSSHSTPRCPARTHAMSEPHQTSMGSRGDRPAGHLDLPCRAGRGTSEQK
jgi:hypothetical protein